MKNRYCIKRTSLVTWDIIDWKTNKVIYEDLSLHKAEEIVKNLEESK